VAGLRDLPGSDSKVRKYVTSQEQYRPFVDKLQELLDVVVPGYLAEGKAYLSIGIGCTGGRHRSVVVADDLTQYFKDRGYSVAVDHRDLDRI
jgi:UPF0042 nucleotide-binding protein